MYISLSSIVPHTWRTHAARPCSAARWKRGADDPPRRDAVAVLLPCPSGLSPATCFIPSSVTMNRRACSPVMWHNPAALPPEKAFFWRAAVWSRSFWLSCSRGRRIEGYIRPYMVIIQWNRIEASKGPVYERFCERKCRPRLLISPSCCHSPGRG